MSRLIRSLAALVALLAALVGVPALLLVLRGNPLPAPAELQGWSDVLLRPDDGSVLLSLVTLVAWVAWGVFALSTLAELAPLLTGQRVRVRLPGLAGPQRVAAGLLLAVLALAVAPAVPHGTPAPPAAATPHPDPAPTTAPASAPTVRASVTKAEVQQKETAPPVHLVRAGDDLWTLAEHYYGEGRRWRQIAAANPDVLTGGPDRLQPGWRLAIPDAVAEGGTVTVRRGDTLSSIAERELGAAGRWPELYRANRAQLTDPDEVATGMRLVLPSPPRTNRPAASPPSSPKPDQDAHSRADHPRPAGARGGSRPSADPPTARPESDGQTDPAAGPAVEESSERASWEAEPDGEDAETPLLALGAVGGLLAAGLVAGLAARRRVQLQVRPLGRRIPHPPAALRPTEAALGRRQRPLTLRSLDLALRALGASCRSTGHPLPPLELVLVGQHEIELLLAEERDNAPMGFQARGRSWVLDRSGADYLRSVPGLDEALRPWPALVTLGRDRRERQVLADLEAVGLLELRAGDAGAAAGVLAALAVELSFSPWAEEMTLTLLGPDHRLPAAIGRHGVSRAADPQLLLRRLERRVAEQRRHGPQPVLAQHRLDPDLADPWTPEIVLVDADLTAAEQERLQALVTEPPRVPAAAVVVGDWGAAWSLRLDEGGEGEAVLQPLGLVLTPQSLAPAESDALVELVAATGRTDTTPAPWWRDLDEPDPPPDNVTYLGRRFGGWAEEREGDEVALTAAGSEPGLVEHPTLLLLGPVELHGATGTPPPRAGKQCLEYCAWLLEHPGRTAHAMASALAVAEGTRRSNMSRLRTWLGESADGEAYLPDAYTGRILLHPSVSSDWQRLQILTAGGVNRAGTEVLRAALQLVRGAPLADAAPGQWHWAEELRTDMISCVRDTGVELAHRALADGDLDLARWAAARALVAAPGDELLVATRIRTEHLAGNPAETERLTLLLAAQARRLGVDLDPSTVTLLQEVMEGRVRARLA